MKYISFFIVIILTALSTFKMNKLEKHHKHRLSHKSTRNYFLCKVWHTAKGTAQGVLEQGCVALGNKAKGGLLTLCDNRKIKPVKGLCEEAVKGAAQFLPKGCAVVAKKVVEHINGKCKRLLRRRR